MSDTLPLSQLRFGHERKEGDINARRCNRDEGHAALLQSIKYYIGTGGSGLILPLAVELQDDNGAPHYVIDGNRRLAALRDLAEQKVIPADHPVPVMRHVPGQALSRSLAANITAVPLHPVDRYTCFAALASTMSDKEIATAFALKPKQVKQALALGALSPKVREAWREGKLEADTAKAFTLADPKRQDQVLKKLLKRGRIYGRHQVVEALVGDDRPGTLLAFVGQDAYEAAGGKMVKDLFENDHVVSDPALVKQLAENKLRAECERLLAEGWSWACTEAELGFPAWQVQSIGRDFVLNKEEKAEVKKLEKELHGLGMGPQTDDCWRREDELQGQIDEIEEKARARGFDKKQKAISGCVVEIDGARLRITYGVVKPGKGKGRAAKIAALEGEVAAAAAKPAISNALMRRLSEQLTGAVGQCLKQDPALALAAIVAAFNHNVWSGYVPDGGPICVREQGLKSKRPHHFNGDVEEKEEIGFGDMLARVMAVGQAKQLELLAEIACRAVDMQTQHASHPPLGNDDGSGEDNLALIAVLKPQDLRAALAEAFDAKDYFTGVARPLCLAAVTEALGEDAARTAGKMKKAELAAYCVQHVPATGWLPPELRTIHYVEPVIVKWGDRVTEQAA